MTDLLSRVPASALAQADGELVARFLGGEQDCGEELVARFQHRLVASLQRWCSGRDEAEDLAQDVWALAFRALGTFNQTAPVWPWLKQIGDNAARSRLRKGHLGGLRREMPWEPSLLEDLADLVEDPTVTSDDVDLIRSCWARLLPREQEVLHLVDVQDLSHQRAAMLLQLTPEGLRQRLCRARQRLREVGQGLAGLPIFQWWTRNAPTQVLGEVGNQVLAMALVPVLAITVAMVTASGPAQEAARGPVPVEAPIVMPVTADEPGEVAPVDSSPPQDAPTSPSMPPVESAPPRPSVAIAPDPSPPTDAVVAPSAGPPLPESQTPVPATDRSITTGPADERLEYSYGVDILRDENDHPPLETSGDDPETQPVNDQGCQLATMTPVTFCNQEAE